VPSGRERLPGGLELARGAKGEALDVPTANSYVLQLETLADAVAGDTPPRLGRDDALGQARTIHALRGSDFNVTVESAIVPPT